MRPGIVFIVLFIVLVSVYLRLADTLGGPATFALQAGIVLMVIGGARWVRSARSRGGWRLFADDSASPEPSDDPAGTPPFEFEVTVLEPTKHKLEVRWWVLPVDEAPPETRDPSERPRRTRGPLEPITAKPVEKTRGKKGVHSIKVKTKDYEPGRYRVVVRVRDTTEVRGDRWLWVLKDEHGVLESERGWWIEVAE